MLLTKKEMLEQWRVRHCLDASGLSGSVDDRFDATDSEIIDLAQMNDWYARLEAQADASLTPPTDIGSMLSLAPGVIDGEWLAKLPDGGFHIVSVELTNPASETEIIKPDCPLYRLLKGPFAPIPTVNPVAIVDGNRLKIFIETGGQTPVLGRVMAIGASPDGFYSITEKGLATIPAPTLYL